MRVTLVVAGNKYTGAAAVAEHCTRALQAVGVTARLLYVGGNNLEARLRDASWADPALAKERRPAHLRANLAAIARAAAASDVVLCHLPHDNFLAVVAGAHRRAPLVRAFRNAAHLRRDPYHRLLARRLSAALLAHREMEPALDRLAGPLPRLALPVPVDDRFRPGLDGAAWRRRLGVPEGAPVVGMVGKMARDRGFDLLLEAAARTSPEPWLILVGHGEARPELERLAAGLGLASRVAWAGYEERGLPGLFAAMDVVVFPAAGSDHGHRAITEAQACGRPVVAVDLPGVRDLVEHGVTGVVAPLTPAGIAAALSELLARPDRAGAIGRAAAAAAGARRLEPSGRRLATFLAEVARPGPR